MRAPSAHGLRRQPPAWAAFACVAVLLAGLLWPANEASVATSRVGADSIRFDDGRDRPEVPLTLPATDVHGTPQELAVGLIGDCEPGEAPPVCGGPPAQWASVRRPVELCAYPARRPGWLSADDFDRTLRAAVEAWNAAEAGIGARYLGLCEGGDGWMARNGRNEIAFDDARDVVRGNTAAVTSSHTSWLPAQQPTLRLIEEADIVFDDAFPASPRCFLATAIHEIGHALGFGHSDDRADVMYPSFSVQTAGSCKDAPSAAERAALQSLYGIDRAPTVRIEVPAAEPGAEVTVLAEATDPEGGPVRFEWVQTAGPSLAINAQGPRARIAPPAGSGAVELLVTVRDAQGHAATARATLPGSAPGAPSAAGAPKPASPNDASAPVLSGAVPASGVGFVVTGNATAEQVIAALGCEQGATLWVAGSDGFIPYVGRAAVEAVNAGWKTRFPTGRLPAGTPVLVRCS